MAAAAKSSTQDRQGLIAGVRAAQMPAVEKATTVTMMIQRS